MNVFHRRSREAATAWLLVNVFETREPPRTSNVSSYLRLLPKMLSALGRVTDL